MPWRIRLASAAALLGAGYLLLVGVMGIPAVDAGAAVLVIVIHATTERVLFP